MTLFRDAHTSEQRMEIHRTVSTDYAALIAGLGILIYCLVIGWLMWQISSPEGLRVIAGAWAHLINIKEIFW